MNFEEKTKNQGTSKPEASQQEVNGDMASWEELVELDDVQLATVVGGVTFTQESIVSQQESINVRSETTKYEGKHYISSLNKGQQAY